jgi:hypothetical protein
VSFDTESVDLHVDFAAILQSDDVPHRDRTRANGLPWRPPAGWHHAEVVAVVTEALFTEVVEVETPFEVLRADGMVKYRATVRADTESLPDDRVRVVDRPDTDGPPSRREFDSSTETFDVGDALDNL